MLSAVSRGPSPIPLQWCHGDINLTVFSEPNDPLPEGDRAPAVRNSRVLELGQGRSGTVSRRRRLRPRTSGLARCAL